MTTPRFMTIRAFAEHVKVDESTVRRLMKRGLPFVRVTVRNPRIDVPAAIAWIEAQSVSTRQENVLH